MSAILIFGTTGLAQLAHHYLTETLQQRVMGFVVDAQYRTQPELLGVPVLTWEEATEQYSPSTHTRMFVAVGYRNMRQRARMFERVRAVGYGLLNIISPASHIAPGVRMGENNFIMPGAVIEPWVVMGDNNVVWSNATLCHHARIGHHNFIAANATLGGHATLGDINFIGFGATVQQHVAMGQETLLGAHSLLREATDDLQYYWGTPARVQRAIDPAKGIELP